MQVITHACKLNRLGHNWSFTIRLHSFPNTALGLVATFSHFTVAAYGKTLAVHASNATVAGTTEAAFKTNLGYSGEQWDASLRMQNLRARAYEPRNGRFIGLDPFTGNMQDPQSLHKYAYVHGDPIQGVDPTGLFTVSGLVQSIAIGGAVGALTGAAAGAAYGAAKYGSFSAAAQGAILGLMYGAATGAALGGATYLLASAIAATSASAAAGTGGTAATIPELLPVSSYIVSMPLRAASAHQAATGIRDGESVDAAFGIAGFLSGYAGLAGIHPWGIAVNLLPHTLRRAVSFRSVKVRFGGDEHEFDETIIGGFVENKTATGLRHPRNRQTEIQWAERQIFDKTVAKLEFIARSDVRAGADVRASGKPFGFAPDPSISELSAYRAYQFRISEDSNAIKIAVANVLARLSNRFPEFEFSAKFGVRADD